MPGSFEERQAVLATLARVRRCRGSIFSDLDKQFHVTAETLQEGVTAETSDDEVSYLEDGPHVTAETSRRICCDASVIRMTEDETGEPLSIGRKSRVIPPAMRRALKARGQAVPFSRLYAHAFHRCRMGRGSSRSTCRIGNLRAETRLGRKILRYVSCARKRCSVLADCRSKPGVGTNVSYAQSCPSPELSYNFSLWPEGDIQVSVVN